MDSKDQRNASVPIGTFQTDLSSEPTSPTSAETTGAYERVDDLPMEPIEDEAIQFGTTRPGRKRTRTLLGVPLPSISGEASPTVPERTENISQAIQDMLDSQTPRDSVPMLRDSEVEMIASEIELAALAQSVPPPSAASPLIAVPPPSAASPLDDFETRQTSPGTALPLLIPSQYAEALERSLHDAPLSFGDDELTTTKRDARQGPTTATAAAAAAIAATANAPVLSIAPDASLGNVSSLAPREREVARPAANRRDAAPGIGLLWVAGMLLVAGGGWLYTAGSFSRSHGAQNTPETPPASAAVSQPKTLPAGPSMSSLATQPSTPAQPPTAADAQSVAAVQPPTSPAPKPTIAGRKLVATSHAPRKAPAAPKLTPIPQEAGASEIPSRGEVVQRLESVRSSVRACANGMSGVADLDITVAHSGAVTHVLVGGDFAGTPQGSCIARAVREARFSSFKQDRFRVLYPYAI